MHEQKTSACGFHSSVWVSQQRVGFTTACRLHSRLHSSMRAKISAACGLHSSTRASQQYASFTTARELHNSTRASLEHASFTCNSIRQLAISSSCINDYITTTVANKDIDSNHITLPSQQNCFPACMQWKQDVRFLSGMVTTRWKDVKQRL